MKIENELLKQPEFIELNGVKFFPEIPKLRKLIWYKSKIHEKWNLCATNVCYKTKIVKGFGFGADGNWMENACNDSWDFYEFDNCIEMTESEIKTALEKEALKRGYAEGLLIETKGSGICGLSINGSIRIEKSGCFVYKGTTVMNADGTWNDIIEIITKEEAEKQLGKKIID